MSISKCCENRNQQYRGSSNSIPDQYYNQNNRNYQITQNQFNNVNRNNQYRRNNNDNHNNRINNNFNTRNNDNNSKYVKDNRRTNKTN